MDKLTLEQAIRVIEEAGGFVMMQGNLEQQEAPLTEAQMDQIEAEERQRFEEYQERKRDAFADFNQILGSKNFSINRVEDMIYEHGLDMDDLEEMIHKYF